MSKQVTAAAEAVGKNFGHYSDLALKGPVMVTRHGRERTVMISAEEYERLKRRDREVLDFANLDEGKRRELIAALEANDIRPTPDLEHEMDGYTP
jgi:prevent-host-death family protein